DRNNTTMLPMTRRKCVPTCLERAQPEASRENSKQNLKNANLRPESTQPPTTEEEDADYKKEKQRSE
ncbi:Hypothetical predicted protein, partial [Olea europaea subsp. europaea]